MAKPVVRFKVKDRKNKRTPKGRLKTDLSLRAYVDNVFKNL